jgi:hypothetical protein
MRNEDHAPGDETLGFGNSPPAAQDKGDAFVAVTRIEMLMKLGMLVPAQG